MCASLVTCAALATLLQLVVLVSLSSGRLLRIPLHRHIRNEPINLSRGTGVELLTNSKNVEYYGPMTIGTPPQEFNILMDTGSSDIWVNSINCDNSTCDVGCFSSPNVYESGLSSTYEPIGRPFRIDYVAGTAVGFLSRDNVEVGGLVVRRQVFAEATCGTIPLFDNPTIDGILGLAFPSIAESRSTPVFFNMIKQELIDKPIFSVWLSGEPDATPGGEIVFGGIDRSRFEGEITYVPLTNRTFWEIAIDGISVLSYPRGDFCQENNCRGILDTGTSVIVGPTRMIDEINRYIGAVKIGYSQMYEVDCCAIETLPIVYFKLGCSVFPLYPSDYVTKQESDNRTICTTGFESSDEDLFTLGDVFLRVYYSIYDAGKSRVGLVKAVQQ